MSVDSQKERAGRASVDYVDSGMRVGLGTGSTANWCVVELGERLADGRLADVVGVPSSVATADLATSLSIPLEPLDNRPLDVYLDGADEVTPELYLTKGGGGALMREKIVAGAARSFVVVAHAAKLVPMLASTFLIPIEVARFGLEATLVHLDEFGSPRLRMDGNDPYVTDNGNNIVDLDMEPIEHPMRVNEMLSVLPGVLDTGIFVNMATVALIAGEDEALRVIEG